MDTNFAVMAGLILRAKAQVTADALAGRFEPRPDQDKDGRITCFSDLHDYVDANYYGGAFDDELTGALASLLGFGPEDDHAFAEVVNQFFDPVQQALDSWIVTGGLTRTLARIEGGFPAGPVRALAAGVPVILAAEVFL